MKHDRVAPTQATAPVSRLGSRLRTVRRAAGLSQEALAAQAGCSTRTVWQAENGQGQADLYIALAALLGMEISGRSLPPGTDLGARLQVLRKRQMLSRLSVALTAGVSPTTVAKLEGGRLGHLSVLEKVGETLQAGLTLVNQGSATTFFSLAATSSAWDAWATPPEVLDRLYRALGVDRFDLDPCSPGRGATQVKAKVLLDKHDDGLTYQWNGIVYMNPPYGRVIGQWTTKAREEVDSGRASVVVGLVPARTDTVWWHRDCGGRADVFLIKGRLAFGDGLQSAPFPSALIVWSRDPRFQIGVAREFPLAQHVPRRPMEAGGMKEIAADWEL